MVSVNEVPEHLKELLAKKKIKEEDLPNLMVMLPELSDLEIKQAKHRLVVL